MRIRNLGLYFSAALERALRPKTMAAAATADDIYRPIRGFLYVFGPVESVTSNIV